MPEYFYVNLIDKNIIPDDCEIFYCINRGLSELPELPDGLKKLDCDNNKIIELPVLPDGLEILYCSYNKLTELPKLPNGLKVLYCYYNPIKYITPDMYYIMKHIYLIDKNGIEIDNTIFYDNSGCSSNAEFFGLE
jgi:Leucine-rich repeat (LRR) protein